MDPSLFVLRRAWLIGRCRRSDINEAFGTERSPNRASKIIEEAVGRWSQHLFYLSRRGVFPNTRAACPHEARAEAILDLLARGAPAAKTGLLPGDGVPLLLPEPKPARAMTPNATQCVLEAALRNHPLEILYVGLRRGERARWRMVWPRAMESTGLHWRLHAQDMEDAAHAYPIKTYLLARVMDARPTPSSAAPRDFRARETLRVQSRLRVRLAEDLTEDQQAVTRNQFDIRDGAMTWPQHALHAFRREYTDSKIPEDIVWPVIARAEEIG